MDLSNQGESPPAASRPWSASAPRCPRPSPPPRSSPTPRRADRGRRPELLRHRRHAAGEGRRGGRAGDQQARRAVREHRRHAGLAHPGPRVVRRRMRARSRSRPPSSATALRCSGPTTACRAPTTPALHKDLKLPKAQLIIRKGYHQATRQLLGVRRGRPQDLDRPRRLPEGARHQDALRHRTGDRLLRRLDRDGRAQGGLRRLRDRGRDARHRPQRIARAAWRRWRQGREAHPEQRHRGLSPDVARSVVHSVACRRAAQ